jgi:hypothetical protein
MFMFMFMYGLCLCLVIPPELLAFDANGLVYLTSVQRREIPASMQYTDRLYAPDSNI